MADYIERETLISALESEFEDNENCRLFVSEIPTADVVEVVRCKDCKHCDPANKQCDHPMGTTLPVPKDENDFCSYGERKRQYVVLTNYEKIKAMSVEELAEIIYYASDKICFDNCTKETGDKYSCKFGEDVAPENCKKCMKHWLESEATE